MQTINGAVNLASNIPNYTANDYAYGAGYLTEKGLELLIIRNSMPIAKSSLGLKTGLGGSPYTSRWSYSMYKNIPIRTPLRLPTLVPLAMTNHVGLYLGRNMNMLGYGLMPGTLNTTIPKD